MHPENSTTVSPAQACADKHHLERMHRGSHSAYQIARILRDNNEYGTEAPLDNRDQHGLLQALEFIAYSIYMHCETELTLSDGGQQ
ncbi:hypothetical protein DQ397_000771 [Pseudomonas sp. CK-NBRI-02]|uniref:hypothetical protein n=1 Tax=Pseudomonas sp. CK-NBRI-02 TaxID=2249759 RepID=UPI0005BBF0AC|nr:hypothetical protein [Pseudomonas sp. CK-NBRI-02]TYO83686.1 hypothetical protein DQ397_000771 [Pseudomonas sp. CK-NBRI-02]